MNKRPVSQVFSASCPCNSSLSQEEMIEKTWHLTSRISTKDCRHQILQVFCALHENASSSCIPPTSHLYPSKGHRPEMLWQDLKQWQTMPHKVS